MILSFTYVHTLVFAEGKGKVGQKNNAIKQKNMSG